MLDSIDPARAAVAAGLAASNTLVLGGLLDLFRPGRGGYFDAYGLAAGWAICLGVSVGLVVLALTAVPLIVPIVLWWVAALVVFRLTVRQTLKLNIAQGVIYWLLVSGVVVAFD